MFLKVRSALFDAMLEVGLEGAKVRVKDMERYMQAIRERIAKLVEEESSILDADVTDQGIIEFIVQAPGGIYAVRVSIPLEVELEYYVATFTVPSLDEMRERYADDISITDRTVERLRSDLEDVAALAQKAGVPLSEVQAKIFARFLHG